MEEIRTTCQVYYATISNFASTGILLYSVRIWNLMSHQKLLLRTPPSLNENNI